jgi:4-hydroxy-tetrahydrodipicolinate reductase
MKIAIIGYGKMGHAIESAGAVLDHQFPLIIDVHNRQDFDKLRPEEVDVAIEFSSPSSAPGNILACLDHGIPVVSGTTGWHERLGEIEQYCRDTGGAFFHASNFSIGVNILFALNEKLAGIMDRFPQYTVALKEIHHIHKLDAPSGTAITLAQQIIREQGRIRGWQSGTEAKPGSVPIESVREDEVKGIHSIRYESDVDILTLVHEAKSRDAFAVGALLAAEFIRGKKGVFGMKDLLKL